MSFDKLDLSLGKISDKYNKKIFLMLGIIFILSLVFVKIRFCHTEVILSVYKYLNPTFLQGDFYLDSLGTYHSQFYFSILIGFFVKLFHSSPEIVLGFFGTFSKLLTILSIFYFGKKISGGSNYVGILTAMFSLISIVSIGGWSLLLDYSRPWSFVHAFLILGITFFIEGKIIPASFLFGIASIFHPELGGTIGGICLVSSYIANFIKKDKKRLFSKIFEKEHIIASSIFFGLLLLNIIPALSSLTNFKLPTERFLEIIGYFRHPMHYIPSTWKIKVIIDFILICLSSLIILFKIKNTNFLKTRTKLLVLSILILMIGGYIFVEIFPLRIWIYFVGFRYSIIIYLFFIAMLAEFFYKDVLKWKENLIWQFLFFFSYFVLWEASAVFLTLLCYLYFNNKYSKIILSILFIVSLFILDFSVIRIFNILLISFFIISINFYEKIKKINLKVILSIIIPILIILLILGSYFIYDIHKAMNKEEYDIAHSVLELTPENSTILIPIDLELVRTEGKRKLFVGPEFPFLDEYMEEWYKRALLAWGEDAFQEVWKMDLNRNYKNMTDSQRDYLNKEYNVNYAILFVESDTNSSIIYSNSKYKLVKI